MLTKNKILSTVAVIAVAIGAFAFAIFNRKPASQTVADTTSSGTDNAPATTPSTPVASATPSRYKDGTYTATGSYDSPGGPDQIGVTLTLANGVITSVSVNPMPGDRTSSRYQSKFVSGYQPYVIGKNIDSLHLGVISGSSLTPIGFNDALDKIKAQAKS
jgi:uncharacterized protein with FMN-binding domain